MMKSLLASLIALQLTGTALAAPLSQAPKLPGDALPLPLVRQATDYSCGAAALLSVLFYWHAYDGGEQSLYRPLKTTKKDGTNADRIRDVARTFGLSAEMSENLTLDDLRAALRQGQTVILDVQAWHDSNGTPFIPYKDQWEDGHYIVLAGLDSRYAYFMDPSTSAAYGYMTLSDLLDRWHDYDNVDGEMVRYYSLGIVIEGKNPVTSVPGELVHID